MRQGIGLQHLLIKVGIGYGDDTGEAWQDVHQARGWQTNQKPCLDVAGIRLDGQRQHIKESSWHDVGC